MFAMEVDNLEEQLIKANLFVTHLLFTARIKNSLGSQFTLSITERNKHMKIMRQIALSESIVALLKLFWQMPAFAMLVLPSEMRKLKFTGGEGEFRCRFGRKIGG